MKSSGALLSNEQAPGTIMHRKTAEIIIEEGDVITQEMIEASRKRKCRRSL